MSKKWLIVYTSLALSACGTERPVLTLPPIERAEPVAYPAIPDGEATCDGAPCLSDWQSGVMIGGLADTLDEANRRILWAQCWQACSSATPAARSIPRRSAAMRWAVKAAIIASSSSISVATQRIDFAARRSSSLVMGA